MKRILVLFTVLIALLSLTGCATILADETEEIAVLSEPSGATVFVDAREVGKTPLWVKMDRAVEHEVLLVLDGYAPAMAKVTRRVQPMWIAADVASGFTGLLFVPVVVDALTDDWETLTPKSIFLKLDERSR